MPLTQPDSIVSVSAIHLSLYPTGNIKNILHTNKIRDRNIPLQSHPESTSHTHLTPYSFFININLSTLKPMPVNLLAAELRGIHSIKSLPKPILLFSTLRQKYWN